jgi:hypothetical protein
VRTPTTPVAVQRNEDISQACVHVECFFGRVLSHWHIVYGINRWGHANFDLDFANIYLLINERMKGNQLVELDYTFYKNLYNMHFCEQEEVNAKHKHFVKKSNEVKKAKVRNTTSAVNHEL